MSADEVRRCRRRWEGIMVHVHVAARSKEYLDQMSDLAEGAPAVSKRVRSYVVFFHRK